MWHHLLRQNLPKFVQRLLRVVGQCFLPTLRSCQIDRRGLLRDHGHVAKQWAAYGWSFVLQFLRWPPTLVVSLHTVQIRHGF